MIYVKLVEIVVEMGELGNEQPDGVDAEYYQEYPVDHPSHLSRRIRDEKDQEREHVDHESRCEEFDKGNGSNSQIELGRGVSLKEYPEQMHADKDIDQCEEQLEVALHLFADMYAGTDLEYAHAADSEARSDKDHVNYVCKTQIKVHSASSHPEIYAYTIRPLIEWD